MPPKKRKASATTTTTKMTVAKLGSLCSKTRALMACMPAHEIAERTGISVATLYRWRAAVPSRVSSASYNALTALHKLYLQGRA